MRFPAVMSEFIKSHLTGVRVALPGRVVAYNPATQRASVQPDIQDGKLDEDEQRQPVTLPVVNDVPIVFPGSGSFRLTFPIAVGDPVLLIFASSSIARWKATKGRPVDPGDDRRHHLSDAIAIPGLAAGAPTTAPDDRMVLHAEDLRLGGPNASDPVMRKSDGTRLVAAVQHAIAAANITGDVHAAAALGFLYDALASDGWLTLINSKVKAT